MANNTLLKFENQSNKKIKKLKPLLLYFSFHFNGLSLALFLKLYTFVIQ
jgi:hypothetical protein